MNKGLGDKLDPKIMIIFLFVGILEHELFELGRSIVLIAGRDAWLSVLIGGGVITSITYLLSKLVIRFPTRNYYEIGKIVWGKPLNYLLILAYLLFWLAFTIILLRNTSDINQTFFLEQTPLVVLFGLFGLGGFWIVNYGFTALTRLFHLFFPFFVIPPLITTVLILPNIMGGNFLPFLEDGILPVLKGALLYVAMFQGLEIILFVGPFLTNPRKLVFSSLVGVNLLNLFALSQMVAVIGVLGVKNIEKVNLSGFAMLQLMEVPGLPVERFELLFTLPLLIGLFTTFCLFLYLISSGIFYLLGNKYRKIIIFLVILMTASATYLIPNFSWTFLLRTYINYATLLFIVALPILTLLLAIIRGKEERKRDQENI